MTEFLAKQSGHYQLATSGRWSATVWQGLRWGAVLWTTTHALRTGVPAAAWLLAGEADSGNAGWLWLRIGTSLGWLLLVLVGSLLAHRPALGERRSRLASWILGALVLLAAVWEAVAQLGSGPGWPQILPALLPKLLLVLPPAPSTRIRNPWSRALVTAGAWLLLAGAFVVWSYLEMEDYGNRQQRFFFLAAALAGCLPLALLDPRLLLLPPVLLFNTTFYTWGWLFWPGSGPTYRGDIAWALAIQGGVTALALVASWWICRRRARIKAAHNSTQDIASPGGLPTAP